MINTETRRTPRRAISHRRDAESAEKDKKGSTTKAPGHEEAQMSGLEKDNYSPHRTLRRAE
jgi:hypothetical protein